MKDVIDNGKVILIMNINCAWLLSEEMETLNLFE